jgi:Mrp family chromosome partitioning ATPase
MKERIGPGLNKNVATHPALNAQVQLLRARVEANLGKPAVIMVTSASTGDGKSLIAYSLAGSFANCDHRVALVSRSCEEQSQVSVLEIPSEDGRKISRDELAAFIEKMRSDYDFTIIDAETFVNSSTAMALTRFVDGILLAVRIGRAPTADDEAMVDMIEQSGGHVVGVVATEASAIADFECARRANTASARPRHRRNTEQNPARALMAAAAERLSG